MSLIGSLFTLVLLGVMGMTLVATVATEQTTDRLALDHAKMLYAGHAAIEYAVREINQGGQPIVVGKDFEDVSLTTSIDAASHLVTATVTTAEAQQEHHLQVRRLAQDCVTLDTSGAEITGHSNATLAGLRLQKSCLQGVTIATMMLSWPPGPAKELEQIVVEGAEVFSSPFGLDSGEVADVADFRMTMNRSYSLDAFVFSSSMMGKPIDLTIIFTDASSITATGIQPGP